MNTLDAQERELSEGDIIRIFNERGACLAGLILTDTIRRGVMELETGAWFDPLDESDPLSLEVHGNPNAVTRDTGTSRLAQSCTAHSCLVQVEKYRGVELPPVKVFEPPPWRPAS
jgi:biotin/methionine sulfoxide reductase